MYKAPTEVPYADNFTFVVIDDCNLRCSYCYEEGKTKHYMEKATADKAVAFLLQQYTHMSSILQVDFIGVEPLMNIEIVKYAIAKCEEHLKGKWEVINFSASTNGTLIKEPVIKERLSKLHCKLILGLSLDGCKQAHDMASGRSFDNVMSVFCFWKKQSPCGMTKTTLSRDGLPFCLREPNFFYHYHCHTLWLTLFLRTCGRMETMCFITNK